jgi:ornithine cyclodeaminase
MTRPVYLDAADLDRLLTPADLADAAEKAFAAISDGSASQPARTLMRLASGGGFGMMPGALADPEIFGIKLVTVFPDGPAAGASSHQGLVLLFDAGGAPRLIIEAGRFTALRTAAASLVATRVLARPGPYVLGLVGAGEQAAAHLALFRALSPPVETLVWARRREAAEAFAESAGGAIATVAGVEEIAARADVICTLTKSATPLLMGAWLRPGQHIVAAGSSSPDRRELDGAAVARAGVYVDWREGAAREAGEIAAAVADGACGPEIVRGEVGEILLCRIPGRASEDEITLFKSLGVAAEDLTLAAVLLRRLDA